MGKKKKTPKMPAYPGPSKTELDIQKQQLALMQQQLEQANKQMGYYEQDRIKAQEAMNAMVNGRPLTAEETALINSLGQQYQDTLTRGINEGPVAEAFNRQRSDAMAALAERGVLDSRTSRNILGDMEKERMRLLNDAISQAGLQKTELEKQFRFNAMNAEQARASMLTGANNQLANYAAGLQNSAMNLGSQAAASSQANRINKYNYDVQKSQLNYLYPQNSGGFMSRISGGLGGALGGLSTGWPWGAVLGGTLGVLGI